MHDNIKTLKEMRAALSRQIAAIDAAIDILVRVAADLPPGPDVTQQDPEPEPEATKTRRRRRAAATKLQMDDVAMIDVQDYNKYRKGGIRTDM